MAHVAASLSRVYLVYFFEEAFKTPTPEPFHPHMHVIPRCRTLAGPGALRRIKDWPEIWYTRVA